MFIVVANDSRLLDRNMVLNQLIIFGMNSSKVVIIDNETDRVLIFNHKVFKVKTYFTFNFLSAIKKSKNY